MKVAISLRTAIVPELAILDYSKISIIRNSALDLGRDY
jgi:hypothetical protein